MTAGSGFNDRKSLYAVSTDLRRKIQDAQTAEEAVECVLKKGTDYFNVSTAVLARVDPEFGTWDPIVQTGDIENFDRSNSVDFRDLPCSDVVREDRPIAHPNLDFDLPGGVAEAIPRIRQYIGAPIRFGERTYGTLSFFDTHPRRNDFTRDDRELIDRLASETERVLNRQELQRSLERHEELTAVLRRILRHNLRNELTVIRGRIELLSEQVGSAGHRHVNGLFERVDNLERLAEKSQDIDSVLSPPTHRQEVTFSNFILDIVSQIQQEYPRLTVNMEVAEESIRIDPSIERGIAELLENAAKHGGDPPIVELEGSVNPEGISLTILDNGPGLPEYERKVFQSEPETQLAHASGIGLWLVSWIVDKNGGDIEVKSTETGTEIHMTIPHVRTPFP